MSAPLIQSGGGGSSIATPVSLANGGTHADLSATGGANQVLKQSGVGADVTVAALVAADIPAHSAALITSGTLALARGGTNADLSATGGASQYLKQASAGVAVTVGTIPNADLPVVNAQDQGYVFSNGVTNTSASLAAAQVLVTVANDAWAVQFVLHSAMTLGRVSYKSGATVVAATHASFGIYDSTGSLKCQGTFDTSVSASTDRTATFTRVTLPPGVYYFGWTTDNATINTTYTFNLGNAIVIDLLNQNTAKRVGKGTASSGGVLNATLGTLTLSGAPNQVMPAVIFDFN